MNSENFGEILDFKNLEEKIKTIIENHFKFVSEFNHLKCLKFKDFINRLKLSKIFKISKELNFFQIEKKIKERIDFLQKNFNRKHQKKNKNYYY